MAAPALSIDITAKTAAYDKAMADVVAKADRSASEVENRFAALSLPTKFLGGLAAGIGVGGILASVKAVVDSLSELGDKAQDFHLPVETLQALAGVAAASSVSTSELNYALGKFSEVSKQDETDGRKFYTVLRSIGEGFVQAFKDAPTQSDRLNVLSSAMSSTTDEVKRAQLGLVAFGSDSERVTGFVAGLNSSLDDFKRKAADMGFLIDDAMVKKAQDAQTQLSVLKNIIGNELTVAIATLIPSMREMLPYLEKIGAAVRDVLAGFGSPSSRPTATLQNEIKDTISILADLDSQREKALAKGKTGNTPISSMFNKRQADAEIADIDKRIEGYAATLSKYREIIDTRPSPDDASPTPASGSAFHPRKTLKKPKAEREDPFDRAVDGISKHTASVNADTAAVFANHAAQQQYRAEFQLLNVIVKENGEVSQDQLETYERLRASMSAQQALEASGITLTDEHSAAFIRSSNSVQTAVANYDKAKEALRQINSASQQIGSALSTAFSDAIVEGKKFGDVMTSLVKTLEKSAINSVIGSFFNAASGDSTSIFGGFLSKLIGRNASGTDSWSGGKTWVGENGPEIVNLPRGAQVVPNNLARGTGGGSHTVAVNIDLTGANGDDTIRKIASEASMQGVQLALSQVPNLAVKSITDHQRRQQ